MACRLQGRVRRAFAPGVRKLYAEFGNTERPAEINYPFQSSLIIIAVETQAAVRYPALRCHVCGFKDQQRAGAHGKLPVMHQVPVVRRTVVGHVLAHRRYHNAVGQFDFVECDRCE